MVLSAKTLNSNVKATSLSLTKSALRLSLISLLLLLKPELNKAKFIKEHFGKLKENIEFQSYPFELKNNKVGLVNPEHLKYSGEAFTLYQVPMNHQNADTIAAILPDIKLAVEKIRSREKEPFIILERGITAPLNDDEIQKILDQDFFIDVRSFSELYEKNKKTVFDSETRLMAALLNDEAKYYDPRMQSVISYASAENINIYSEHMSVETSVLSTIFMRIDEIFIPKYFSNLEGDLITRLKQSNKAFNQSLIARNTHILKRAEYLSKELKAVPIIIMGAGHNLKEVSGSEKLIFLDSHPNVDYAYRKRIANPLMGFIGNILDLHARFGKIPHSLEKTMLVTELLEKAEEKHILKLMSMVKKNFPHDANSLVRIIAGWLYDDVDPLKTSKIWKHL